MPGKIAALLLALTGISSIALAPADPFDGACTMRDLVAEVRKLVEAEDSSGGVDAKARLLLLEKLEQINLLALRIQRDAGR
jgi:hypothetical protein